jgi:hypothetical protein
VIRSTARILLAAALWIGAPCFANAVEQVVWWPLVTDGQEYRRVPYPQEAGPLSVRAGSEVVLEARRAPVRYWPITREYLADFSQDPEVLDGRIEIVDSAGEVTVVEPEPYVVWHPAGVGAGPPELIHGGEAEALYERYLEEARTAAARDREYQRIVGAHQAAVEAWLRLAAERRGQGMPAPPPELEIAPPEPSPAYATEPAEAAVVALPEGAYTVRIRASDGAIVPGSERALVSFGPLDRALGYVLRPEDRWTQPVASLAPDQTINTTGRTDLFFQPVPVVEYDAQSFTRLFRPQSIEAAGGSQTLWTQDLEHPAEDGALVLWDGDALVETLPRTPWRVAQLAGASRGYSIEPLAPDDGPLEPDFSAMRVPAEAEVTRIDLVDDAGAPVTSSTRRFRKVERWPQPLFLPALLPLALWVALKFGWRRRFG